MRQTTMLVAATVLATGCDNPGWWWGGGGGGDGEWHHCMYDETVLQLLVCVSPNEVEQFPGIIEAACAECEEGDYNTVAGCAWSYDGADAHCEAREDGWYPTVESDLATVGWRAVSKGRVNTTTGNTTTLWAFPEAGWWPACAYAKLGALYQGREQCQETVQEIIDTTDADSLQFLVASEPFKEPFDVVAYCESVVTQAEPDPEVDCPAELILDPDTSELTWADGTSGAVDCDLNQTCCAELGVCSAIHDGAPTALADEVQPVTGTVTVSHVYGVDEAVVEGTVALSAPDCRSDSGNCPLYLESIDLSVARIGGADGVGDYGLTDLQLSLPSPTLGVWRPKTGEVFVPSEALWVDVSATTAFSDWLGDLGTLRTSHRATTPLTGTWDGTHLTLTGGRASAEETVDLAVESVPSSAR